MKHITESIHGADELRNYSIHAEDNTQDKYYLYPIRYKDVGTQIVYHSSKADAGILYTHWGIILLCWYCYIGIFVTWVVQRDREHRADQFHSGDAPSSHLLHWLIFRSTEPYTATSVEPHTHIIHSYNALVHCILTAIAHLWLHSIDWFNVLFIKFTSTQILGDLQIPEKDNW